MLMVAKMESIHIRIRSCGQHDQFILGNDPSIARFEFFLAAKKDKSAHVSGSEHEPDTCDLRVERTANLSRPDRFVSRLPKHSDPF